MGRPWRDNEFRSLSLSLLLAGLTRTLAPRMVGDEERELQDDLGRSWPGWFAAMLASPWGLPKAISL